MIRTATPDDLDVLVELEEQSFRSDRISRNSYRRLIRRDSCVILVDEEQGEVRGSVVLLFRRGLAAARLYSLAVAPRFRGKGVGRILVDAALKVVVERDCLLLRLEVREDNREAIALYQRRGFEYVGRIKQYYDDGADALRYQVAAVESHKPPNGLNVPYYQQTLDFTCGSACLMMALRHFQPEVSLTRALEVNLWREATTVFMTTGIGGCSAEGLAVAAANHGLHPLIVTSDRSVPFISTVRSPEKKEVIELVHHTFRRQLKEDGHPVIYRRFTKRDIMRAIDADLVPILLVSGYRLYGEKIPHWVVVTGYDEHFIYIHDPYVPEDVPEYRGLHVPLHEHDFTRINRYGRHGTRSMVLVGSRPVAPKEIFSRKRPVKSAQEPGTV